MNLHAIARLFFTLAAVGLTSGCMIDGPSVITYGRSQYADAITQTNDQQTLGAIVRMRYGETYGMLTVTSVTANISVKTNAQVQVGVGPDSNFSGNLVPLSGGVAYEENPTITYAPVEGSQFLKEYLSPNPLEVVVLAARSTRNPAFVLSLLLERINDLWNPETAAARTGDSRFTRALQLMELLRARGELEWGEAEKPGTFAVVMIVRDGGSAEMRELIDLLKVHVPATELGRVVLPLRLSSLDVSPNTIDISTRSVYDLMQLAGNGVEVPEEDLAAGLVSPPPPRIAAAPPLRVKWSPSRPSRAAVEVRHGSGWFYLDSTDHQSKAAFNIIQALLAARARSSVNDGRSAPLLTVPVSK